MVSVVYLTRINFFSNKAHVHTITKTCEALHARDGVHLTLVSTDNSLKTDREKNDFFTTHKVLEPFPVISLSSIANTFVHSSNFFVYNFGTLCANISLIAFLWKSRKQYDVVYVRDHLILPVTLFARYILGKKIVYESHYILTKKFGQWLTEKTVSVSHGVVAIAITLKEYYEKYNKNIIVSFCASSDKEQFEGVVPKAKPIGEKRLVYTGNIDVTGNGDTYGVEDVVRALPLLSEDVHFYAVGKKSAGVHPHELLAESLGVRNRFHAIPWVTRSEAVQYILSADVLIIPKSGGKPGNSPTKMFEYLASGRPIVAADTVPMREVLKDESNALLVDYASSEAWSKAVQRLFDEPVISQSLVDQALKDARLYTWRWRGESIGKMIQSLYAQKD